MSKILSSALAKYFPSKKFVFTASATSSIYLVLSYLRKKNGWGVGQKKVIVPASVSPSVVFAVCWAGFEPEFCDVEPETYGIGVRSLQKVSLENCVAVILVYLFGKGLDTKSVVEYCRSNNLIVVEDLAQSVGGLHEQKYLGNFGDYAVLSFNHKKIIQSVDAGAIVCGDDEDFERLNQEQKSLPRKQNSFLDSFGSAYQDIQKGWAAWYRMTHFLRTVAIPKEIVEDLKKLFVFQNELSSGEYESLAKEVDSLDSLRQKRHESYSLYAQHLSPKVDYPKYSQEDMCWRLPILLPKPAAQVELLQTLRKKGALVSDHYFPASLYMGKTGYPQAEAIGSRCLNLWVDQKLDKQLVPSICSVINNYVEEI